MHYHGTPITPRVELSKMAGKNFCVSYADPRDADWCLLHGQSIMWDNGAFSIWRSGRVLDISKFSEWVESRLAPPHWAVVPDVIEGTVQENLAAAKQWSLSRELGCVVWHMNEPLSHLFNLLDLGFGKIAFGSTNEVDPIGGEVWIRKADAAFNALAKNGPIPWVHMMRGLSLCGDRWPFASADSTNVARNHKNVGEAVCPERMARRIDSIQCPINWTLELEQKGLFENA